MKGEKYAIGQYTHPLTTPYSSLHPPPIGQTPIGSGKKHLGKN